MSPAEFWAWAFRPRTIISLIRTLVYAVISVVLMVWHGRHQGQVTGVADGILVGGILGDYLTWLVWSIIELPEHLAHGCYDAGVNLLFGVLLFRLGEVNVWAQAPVETVAFMFLAFLFVSGVKGLGLGVLFVEDELEDDG